MSTAPRPYLTDELPCSRSGVCGAWKSRPGKSRSMRARNAGSIAITSSKAPCVGARPCPSRSGRRARRCLRWISPGLPSTSSARSRLAGEHRARAPPSRTAGTSESVVRGQPSGGKVRSFLRCSGAGAQAGWKGLSGSARRSVRTGARADWPRCREFARRDGKAVRRRGACAGSIVRRPLVVRTRCAKLSASPCRSVNCLDRCSS